MLGCKARWDSEVRQAECCHRTRLVAETGLGIQVFTLDIPRFLDSMPAAKTPLADLFRRLKKIGFDEQFVREVVLPDWWEDSLFGDPASRAQIELRVAQRLSLPLVAVATVGVPLVLSAAGHVCLKRAKAGAERDKITPGLLAAKNAIGLLTPHLRGLAPLPANLTTEGIRAEILQKRPSVDFASLVEYCWQHGIAVFNFPPPKGAKKFAGMAYYDRTLPVVVLGSGHDAPPRQAFYLAHEMSHIFRGHVKPGEMLADADLENQAEDLKEQEADGDAIKILTGASGLNLKEVHGLTALKLASQVRKHEQQYQIHPGTLALMYGRAAERMPAAVLALKFLNMDTGAKAITASALRRVLCPDPRACAELPGPVLELLPVFGIEA